MAASLGSQLITESHSSWPSSSGVISVWSVCFSFMEPLRILLLKTNFCGVLFTMKALMVLELPK